MRFLSQAYVCLCTHSFSFLSHLSGIVLPMLLHSGGKAPPPPYIHVFIPEGLCVPHTLHVSQQ